MKKLIPSIILLIVLSVTACGQTLMDQWVVCNQQDCKILDPYYSEGVTVKWTGTCVNSKANGFGKLIKYKNGEYESTYEGEYKNGIREGKGKFSHFTGTVLECAFKDGQAIGHGVYDYGDGNKYEGEIVNYRTHGKGKISYANGGSFEGFFVADKPYTGKFIGYDGKVTYIQAYYPVDRIKEVKTEYKAELGKRVTEFFDENWKRCKQKNASYYRLVTYESPNKPVGVISDYYITGQLQSKFYAVYLDYDDEGKNFHEGEATWYFKNGKTKQKKYYFNNKINGKNTFYYDNGQVSQEAEYLHGILDGLYLQWYKTGKPKIVALYNNGKLDENKYIEYDENGLGALVYKEIFKNSESFWTAKVEGSSSEITESNKVSLYLNKNGTTCRYNYITLNQNSSYSIESILQKKIGKGSEGYGILFGFKDWNNYYQFLISEYGSFIIMGKFEGITIKISEWEKSRAINTGNKRNLLKVMKLDGKFIFSINGQVVKRTKSKTLRGNNFGIIANGSGQYYLENIIVREFVTVEELAQKARKFKKSEDWKGNGSGFFISQDGYIATNYHVIKEAKEIQVEYYQKGIKKTYKAQVIVTDKQNDLAIIKIQNPNFGKLPSIPYVFSSSTKDVGTEVFALGYPIANIMGAEIKFTDGKISSKTGVKGDITVYQISVPIQPGNSGGPLFDSKGNLVGITSSALNKAYFNTENVNYAIKTSYLKSLIDVMPESIVLPNNTGIYSKPLTEKIKVLSEFVPLIKVK